MSASRSWNSAERVRRAEAITREVERRAPIIGFAYWIKTLRQILQPAALAKAAGDWWEEGMSPERWAVVLLVGTIVEKYIELKIVARRVRRRDRSIERISGEDQQRSDTAVPDRGND